MKCVAIDLHRNVDIFKPDGMFILGVILKTMREMCYKMTKNHISLIHFNIIFEPTCAYARLAHMHLLT